MKKKSIAAILVVGIIVILSAFSPLFMSEFQNKKILGKVYLSEKENDGVNRNKINLLQKIELFQNQMQEKDRDESYDSSVWESDGVGKSLNQLVDLEILPIHQEEFIEGAGQSYAYWIPTDEKDNHIIIYKTVVSSLKKDGFNHEPYIILWVEQETGKIIGFKAKWILFIENKLPEKEEIAEKWAEYLGKEIKMIQKNETNFEYQQEDAVVKYEIIIEEGEYKILPVF